MDKALIRSVNLAQVRQIMLRGKPQNTGIWKLPVEGRVKAAGFGLVGDTQADLQVHGGWSKAVYVYSVEDYDWWSNQLGRPMKPGTFGENLTVEGIAVNDALIGEHWRVGSVEFEVTQPRQPCWKLGVRMENPNFPRRFSEAGRAGAYLAIVEEGDVGAGDEIVVTGRPSHPITLGMMAGLIYHDQRLAGMVFQLLEAGLTPEEWAEVLSGS